MLCDEIERQQTVIQIAELKEAVKFLLSLVGETTDLTPHAEKKYEELIIKLDVNV